MKKPSAVLIFGPTGVGKTDLLVDLFAESGEVISADSMQVYRGMDIGTAKPSESLRRKIPHHLLDIHNPDEQFTVGDFVKAAESLIPAIAGRGKVPIVSGGTAYYFRNLMYGLSEAPPGDDAIRTGIEAECRSLGLPAMYERLKTVDPESASRISPRDRYRILRALEVHEVSRRPLSFFAVPRRLREDFRFLVIGLFREREELYRRIDRRVDEMFEEGLKREVAGLLRAGYAEDAPGMRGIGYREFILMKRQGCLRIKDTADLIKRNSRRYAKRQITFFKTLPGVMWLDPRRADEIRRLLDRFLSCDFLPFV